MTREERKREKLHKEQEFLENKDSYYSECFIKNDDFYKMMDILKSSESRGVVKEYGFELHHGVPRSYFKKKHMTVIDKNNLFKLTYSEHFMVHYYAYKCASPFLKSSMTLALIQMKRVCAKNTDEYDTILLSKIFESIKLDLYNDRKKQEKVKTFQKAKEKFDKKFNGKFTLLSVVRIHEPSNDRLELQFRCKRCNKLFFIKSGVNFLNNMRLFRCDCERGYQENVSVLLFGINEDHKAEWYVASVAYTNSMKNANAFINKNHIKQQLKGHFTHWIKYTIIDIKPSGYVWNLDEKRKYNPYNEKDIIVLSDLEESFIREFWDCDYVSNAFFTKNLSHSISAIKRSLKLNDRKFTSNKQLCFRVDYSDEELSIKEWEKKLNKSWYRIIKEHTVIKVPMFTDVFKLLLDLKYQNPELLEFIFQFIELAKKQNLSEECLDVMLNTSIEELDLMVQINDGKDICDYRKEAKNSKK